jgi:hypothetical protein
MHGLYFRLRICIGAGSATERLLAPAERFRVNFIYNLGVVVCIVKMPHESPSSSQLANLQSQLSDHPPRSFTSLVVEC